MIFYINSSEKDICLVAIDFAGLSMNTGDSQSYFKLNYIHFQHIFASTHKKLTTVIIGTLPYVNKFCEFKREAALNDPTILSPFYYRPKPVQRSKKA